MISFDKICSLGLLWWVFDEVYIYGFEVHLLILYVWLFHLYRYLYIHCYWLYSHLKLPCARILEAWNKCAINRRNIFLMKKVNWYHQITFPIQLQTLLLSSWIIIPVHLCSILPQFCLLIRFNLFILFSIWKIYLNYVRISHLPTPTLQR